MQVLQENIYTNMALVKFYLKDYKESINFSDQVYILNVNRLKLEIPGFKIKL